MNRRELLKALSAGAVITTSGLWFPGQKLISIPKKRIIQATGIDQWGKIVSFEITSKDYGTADIFAGNKRLMSIQTSPGLLYKTTMPVSIGDAELSIRGTPGTALISTYLDQGKVSRIYRIT